MEERMCIEEGCGEKFVLSQKDIEYYSGTITDRKKGSPTYGTEIQMVIPKRCPKCRAKNKAARERV